VTLISKFKRKLKPDAVDPADAAGGLASESDWMGNSTDNGYCHTLTHGGENASEGQIDKAWEALRKQMALVPEGEVWLSATDPISLSETSSMARYIPVWVDSLYIDRTCVTHRDFAQFVAAGGYTRDNLWPPEILSNVLQFVDSTGCPGPKYWREGRPPKNKLNHPVTGICWYEANAYAHWRGKRLLTPAEWQWAAIWAGGQSNSATQRRFPWGDSFDPQRCNTWNSGIGTTVPVDEYYSGCTPNGVYQLIGNVWEWTSALFDCDDAPNGDRVLTEYPLAEVRGGAFDSYFASQATAQFRTGQSLMFRGPNVGFRCCVSAEQLVSPSDPYPFLDDEAVS
jgi:iron(II)-dependent oxidoreductase